MSKKEKITITCPKCKNEHPFIIWSSINTTLDPEMKAAVKDKSPFCLPVLTVVRKPMLIMELFIIRWKTGS